MKEFKFDAPKDAVDRKSVYIMVDTLIEATKRSDGTYSQEIYLDDGRLEGKLEIVGGITDSALRRRLCDCRQEQFLLKGIGVSVSPVSGGSSGSSAGSGDSGLPEMMPVMWKHYGRKDRYGGGTTYRFECPTDGSELIYIFDENSRSQDDDVIGNLTFWFSEEGQMAEVNVRLIVDDSVEVPACEKEDKVDRDSEAYRRMIARSLISSGRNGRLGAAISRWKAGEEVTVAYIGGSITQGAGAKPIAQMCYAYRSFSALCERYGSNQTAYVKAGVGGTSSEFGLMRYQKEVCQYGACQPDIVVIEFAVNDSADETGGRCLESLVREALRGPKHPAVILLFSVFANDQNLQARMIPVGNHYGLPMVSVLDAVVPQFSLAKGQGRVISKRQYFYDTFHPTNTGHQVMADCLVHLFETVELQQQTDLQGFWKSEREQVPAISCYGKMFDGIQLIERNRPLPEGCKIQEGSFSGQDRELQCVERNSDSTVTPEFAHNWMHISGQPGQPEKPFQIILRAKDIFLVFKDSGSLNAGVAAITVDGKPVYEADPHINNWTHCNVKLLWESNEADIHTVEIRMKPGQEDKEFTVLGFGYTL